MIRRKERFEMAKLRFVEAQHPQMLSYIACQSTPHFYLVEEPEPEKKPEPMRYKVRRLMVV